MQAAYELIAEVGVGSLTHRLVAARAGVPLGATTYYFATLDDLVSAALDHAVTMAADGLHSWEAAIEAGSRLPDTLAALIVSYVQDHRQAMVEFELYLAAAHRPALRPLPRVWIDGLNRILAERVGPHAAQAAVVFIDGAVLHALINERTTDTALLSRALEALLAIDTAASTGH